MEGSNNVNQKLFTDNTLDGKFKVSQKEKNVSKENCFKTCVEEIEKMDVILKMKISEEKRIKLSRIKAEEESRSILSESIAPNVSTALKVNFREFTSLLNRGDRYGLDGRKAGEKKILGEEREMEKSEKCESRQRSSEASFIQKNIQLAKCGRGILSLTEEEQLRLQNLLAGIEDTSEESDGLDVAHMKNLYGLDDESKFILNQIDRELEVFEKFKGLKGCSGNLVFFAERTEGEKSEENTENDENKKTKKNRLKEINKLLGYATSVSSEEISPLSQEDIELLVNQGKESVDESLAGNKEATELLTSKISQDVVADLVSNAKYLMPKFKYRFDDT